MHTLSLVERSLRASRLAKRCLLRNPIIRLLQTSPLYYKDDRNMDCGPPPCPQLTSRAGYYALGAVILGTGAVVVYAKNDEDFRDFLKDTSPTMDKFVNFITAEDMPRIDFILKIILDIKDMLVNDIMQIIRKQSGSGPINVKPTCEEETGNTFRAPVSAFKELVSKDKPDKYEEARALIITPGGKEEIKRVVDSDYKDKKKKKPSDGNLTSTNPMTLISLEKEINQHAETAIRAYFLAGCYLREFLEDLVKLFNISVENADRKLWEELKKKGAEKNTHVEDAEKSAQEAESKIEDLQARLNDPELPGGDEARSMARRNIDKILKQLTEAKTNYENERNNTSTIDRLWPRVLEARRHFMDEIEVLNPQFRLTDRVINLSASEMNLFMHNAVLNTLHLQTEMLKMNSVGMMRLKTSIDQGRQGDANALDTVIEMEFEKEKRRINREYYKKLLTVKAECERQAREQIEGAGLSFDDIKEDALAQKEREVMRKLLRQYDDDLMEEREKQRDYMAGILGRLKGMDDLMKVRTCSQDKSGMLWSACEAFQACICGFKELGSKPFTPLEVELLAIRNLMPDGDEFIPVVLATVPSVAKDRGVYSPTSLKERYISVQRVAQRVGFLPDGGGSLVEMIIGYLKALLIITPANPIPCFELVNEPIETDNLDNLEILQRSKFFMDKGDWYMVLGYLNLLKGASRVVAQDYINELTLYLEVKMLAESLVSYASAVYLAF